VDLASWVQRAVEANTEWSSGFGSYAGHPSLEVPEERLPQSLETAFYFTVAEALTNVAKYANATQACVTVAVADGLATAEVSDDGCGGASATAGSGLRGLADRLEAIGGSLEVESPEGGGTVVRACVPLDPPVGP